jgi:hypothetical protein
MFADVRVVAYADDVHLQGPPPSGIKAFCFLVAATAEIGLSPSLSKCTTFLEDDTRSRAAAATSLVTSPTSLPLPVQDKFLLLRSSLQARLTHLTRTTPWRPLSPHFAASERQVLHAALLLVDHPAPKDLPADPVVAQLTLLLRFGGFSLHNTVTNMTSPDRGLRGREGPQEPPRTWERPTGRLQGRGRGRRE